MVVMPAFADLHAIMEVGYGLNFPIGKIGSRRAFRCFRTNVFSVLLPSIPTRSIAPETGKKSFILPVKVFLIYSSIVIKLLANRSIPLLYEMCTMLGLGRQTAGKQSYKDQGYMHGS